MTYPKSPVNPASIPPGGGALVFSLADQKVALEIEKVRLDLVETRLHIQHREGEVFYSERQMDASRREDTHLPFRSYVDTISLERLNTKFRQWHDSARRHPLGPVTIEITSPGGDIFSGFGHYDLIRDGVEAGLDVTTEVQGYAASMASVIAQAGKRRTITANSWLMIHEAATVRQQLTQLAEMRDQFTLLDQLQSRIVNIYAARSRLTAGEISERCYKKDWWLTAEEALEYGFVDEITRHVPEVPYV